eukprot:CAMPEP_0119018912 /NCGR_PEP_ID=MMETSP1176-20130426/20565_1 /TAXON_ID=265551 /ORGANISM="Synedropsis recta cf, Strain CCMP1620" /LENGTH=261 /DNA_ID=CAMNT_0006973017 /DNA_START=101 /DNA_END=886 /DNA_ORIENTATION=+
MSSSRSTPSNKVRLSVPSGGDFTSPRKNPQYLQRLTDVGQMDIQAALDQMRSLLGGRPQVVYKTAYYRKQTKNHWYRDDPAFCALQGAMLTVSAIAYAVAFRATLTGGVSFLLYSLFWNWLVPGVIVASVGREIANRHLSGTASASHVKQTVEWLYAFDIHCNAFFPLFCLLYVAQFFMLPLVLGQSLFALVVSNTLYAAALSWYWYITHLGYRSLPFLSNTEVFLFPIAAVLLVYCLNLIGYPFGMGWNASRLLTQIYFY